MDRMRALEVFVEVAERGTLSGAARGLRLSAPSVTRIVGELEDEIGVLLLHRTTRAVTLTEPGRVFLESARRLVDDFQSARDLARGAQAEPTGVLRITASLLFGQHYVSPLLREYLDAYAGVRAEAHFLDRVVNLVEEGFDIAVRIGPLPDSNLVAVRVGQVRRVVCGHESYFEKNGVPRKPADLTHHQVISASAVTATNRWKFADGKVVKVDPRLTFSSVSAAIGAATAGWGVTRVLSYQIGPELGEQRLVTVLSDFEPAPIPIHLVHAEGRAASAKVRSFIALAKRRLRDHAHLQ